MNMKSVILSHDNMQDLCQFFSLLMEIDQDSDHNLGSWKC